MGKKGEEGSLLAPTLPVNFADFWKQKVAGYEKYGPTFIQNIKPCKASSHPLDKMTVRTADGKTVIVPLPNKSQPIDGGERVVVRGGLELGNLQRMKFTFPRQSEGTPLFEIIDGYVESVTYDSEHQLEITLLIPHEDDLLESAHPFGPSHPAPKNFYHHHNCHSRLFNVEPMKGSKLIAFAGADKTIAFPEGVVMEYTIVGIAAACVGAACAVGAALTAGAVATGFAVAGAAVTLGAGIYAGVDKLKKAKKGD